jgi:hypothetical protein
VAIFSPANEDAPRLTAQGQRMWCCPTLSGGATMEAVRPAGCAGCSKAGDHEIADAIYMLLPHGQHRYGVIPAKQRQDVTRLHRLQSFLWLRSFVLWGFIGNDLIYNAGPAGDNASQAWLYEITGASGSTLTLVGQNPKYLTTGKSRVNPEWPLPDPDTGETSRLIWETEPGAMLACAAAVEFLPPSVLAGRLNPLISRITMPDSNAATCEFTVHFDDGRLMDNARQPLDLAFPPEDGKYYCNIRMEFLRPQVWKDYQAPFEGQITRVRQDLDSGPGVYTLKRSDGTTDTKVIFPSMAAGAVQVILDTGAVVDVESRLLTTWDGAKHVTTLDLTGLTFGTGVAIFWAESLSGDTARQPCQLQCSRSKVDPSGSWIHAGGPQHCSLVTSTGFAAGLYHQKCWLPGRCSGFTLEDESIGTAGDANFLGSLWTRAGWIIEQGMPGVSDSRNFTFTQRDGASIQGFAGSWCDEVPGGFFPRRWEFFGRKLGKHIAWTDGDGDGHMALVHGAFYLGAHDYSDTDGPVYAPDANASAFTAGIVAELVDDWADDKAAMLAGFPWRGCTETNVYSYSTGGGAATLVNTVAPDSEAYIVAINVNEVGDEAAVERLRSIY